MPRRATLLSVGIAALILLISLVISFFTDGPGWAIVSPRGAAVAAFSGNGDGATSPFRVREGWRIRWESAGDRFAMTILGDANMGTVVDVAEPGNGLTAPPSKGTFYVNVSASGSWTVTVLQGR